LVGDGNELAHRAFLADERRAMALSFHATLISNAEPKEWFDSVEARLEAAAKRKNTVEKAAPSPTPSTALAVGQHPADGTVWWRVL
jgi:hypothetical protein